MCIYVGILLHNLYEHNEDRIFLEVYNMSKEDKFNETQFNFRETQLLVFVHLRGFDKNGDQR